jgi:hypothetical protein
MMLFSCHKKQTDGNQNTLNNNFQEACTCEEAMKTDSVIFATHVRLEKKANQNILVFRCASVVTGTASVSNINGNDAYCEAIYDIQCTSSAGKSLELSSGFKYFTDEMKSQSLFFEDLKSHGNNYFEFELGRDRKISSISKLNIK